VARGERIVISRYNTPMAELVPLSAAEKEPTYLGEYGTDTRIASYRVEAWSRGQWREVFAGESPREMVYRKKPTSAERVRLSLRGTGKPPGIAEFGLYAKRSAAFPEDKQEARDGVVATLRLLLHAYCMKG